MAGVGSYQRLFYDRGFLNLADLKKIRNEMDLLDMGVRKRTQAFKLMKVIRETDPEHWENLEAEGDVPELDLTKFPRMELSSRGDETTTGKVKSKKGSELYAGRLTFFLPHPFPHNWLTCSRCTGTNPPRLRSRRPARRRANRIFE
eukprot:COSAG03_NODE_4785_length_1434_cov_2.250936_2_plen_146_part_00